MISAAVAPTSPRVSSAAALVDVDVGANASARLRPGNQSCASLARSLLARARRHIGARISLRDPLGDIWPTSDGQIGRVARGNSSRALRACVCGRLPLALGRVARCASVARGAKRISRKSRLAVIVSRVGRGPSRSAAPLQTDRSDLSRAAHQTGPDKTKRNRSGRSVRRRSDDERPYKREREPRAPKRSIGADPIRSDRNAARTTDK